jgi:arabinofuranan 3-O-arabinosyltransferase
MTLSPRLRTLAYCWIAVAGVAYLVDLLQQTRDHLTNGALRPFGDDFLSFWSAPYLAWHGRAAAVYDWNAFHAFTTSVAGAAIQSYQYNYPPPLLVLSAPLAFVPYLPALFVWLIGGWFTFYAALRVARPARGTWLLALATPAVLINAISGQNGAWTAALLGGGLSLLERRPGLAGVLFGLLIVKPQLAVLLPLALLAARQFRAFVFAGITAAVVALASVLLWGTEPWSGFFQHIAVMRHLTLEDGTGVWHRFVSVFVALRRLGVGIAAAYAVQAVVALIAAAVMAIAWYRDIHPAAKNTLLVLATWLATPYVQDYDLVAGAFVVVWLAELYPAPEQAKPALVGAGLILLVPLFAALLARQTGYAFGPLFIAPVFALVAHTALLQHAPSATRVRAAD